MMVVFTCGECGEAMKKAQVEGHYKRKCRNCNVLSCLDCGKDFWGKDYEQHTKCISEEEKYSGKNYVAKPNANKGEVKQQQWLHQVQSAIDKVKTNPKLRDILERMKDYPNIPRKQAKFVNFLGNSLRVYNKPLASQVWDLLMTNTDKPQKPEQAAQNGDSNPNKPTEKQQTENSERLENSPDPQSAAAEEPVKKLNKREKKEERRKKANKTEKKHKHQVNGSEDTNDCEVGRKKSKKRKNQESDEEEELEEDEEKDVKQGKKRKHEEEAEEEEDEASPEPQKKVFKTKFNWNEVIVEVLQSKGEMKLKKLKKKVLAEYLAQGCTAKSEEKLWAKFDHKLKKNTAVKVLHDRAKLIG